MQKPPVGETFEWIVEPQDGVVDGEVFVDGSRLYAEHDLYGLCARQGWAFTVYDEQQKIVAAAKGRTPQWAEGIHATELYGLLMAASLATPQSTFKIDCLAVREGARSGTKWAAAPCRRLGRTWCSLSAALDAGSEKVEWMPAHCTEKDIGVKLIGDGSLLTAHHIAGNDSVDVNAKSVARRDRPSRKDMELVRTTASHVQEIALWLGMVTVLANHFPLPATSCDDSVK